jgi:hypothetical protein
VKTTRQMYCQYLLVSQINYTCTNLAEHFENLDHNSVYRYLKTEKLDFVATTTAQGSNAWSNDYTDFFDGLDVMILPDNDQPGRKYANDVALSLWGIAKSVKIIQLPI